VALNEEEKRGEGIDLLTSPFSPILEVDDWNRERKRGRGEREEPIVHSSLIFSLVFRENRSGAAKDRKERPPVELHLSLASSPKLTCSTVAKRKRGSGQPRSPQKGKKKNNGG